MNKHALGSRSMYNKKDGFNTTFFFAKVESNIDDSDSGTIRARIDGVDKNEVTTIELPTAFPLQPKMYQVVPKVGETVIIFVPDMRNPYVDRVFMGPIISQPQFQYRDNFISAKSGLNSGLSHPQPAPSSIPENLGVNPDKEDVSIQGRDNADIILKSNEVLIRAGKFITTPKRDDIKIFNKENPAYIQLKHNVILSEDSVSNEFEKGTVANIVASKINLLTHKNGQPRFILNDQVNNITDKEMLKILETAHPLIFGDLLVEYLKLQRAAFINHVHPYHGKKAQDLSGSEDIDNYMDFDLNRLVSKNIRIN